MDASDTLPGQGGRPSVPVGQAVDDVSSLPATDWRSSLVVSCSASEVASTTVTRFELRTGSLPTH